MTFEEAEAEKRRNNLPDNYESELAATLSSRAWRSKSSRACSSSLPPPSFTQVNHIVLAGGCAVLPGADQVVASRTQINTIIANPFADMVVSDRVTHQEPAVRRVIADGRVRPCATEVRRMIRINLLPHREERNARPGASSFMP